MAESILVTGKRISSMELVTNVTGIEKIPTGQPDDLAITPNQIADHTISRGDLASQGDLSQVEVDITTQIATLASDVATEDNSIRGLIAAEEAARIAADDALQAAIDAGDTSLQSALDAEVAARISADDLKVDLATTVQTFFTPEAGVDSVTGVADGAYFNVRSEGDETVAIEYQNVGGVPTPSGKSYPSTAALNALKESIIDPDTQKPIASKIFDDSGLSVQHQLDKQEARNKDQINARDWGILPTNSPEVNSANWFALNNAFPERPALDIFVPVGVYGFSDGFYITRPHRIRGVGVGELSKTVFNFSGSTPVGTVHYKASVFIIHSSTVEDTSGNGATLPAGQVGISGTGATIECINVLNSPEHGIIKNAPSYLNGVAAIYSAKTGILTVANTGGGRPRISGIANQGINNECAALFNGHNGFAEIGDDANVIKNDSCLSAYNEHFGFYDGSLNGGTNINGQGHVNILGDYCMQGSLYDNSGFPETPARTVFISTYAESERPQSYSMNGRALIIGFTGAPPYPHNINVLASSIVGMAVPQAFSVTEGVQWVQAGKGGDFVSVKKNAIDFGFTANPNASFSIGNMGDSYKIMCMVNGLNAMSFLLENLSATLQQNRPWFPNGLTMGETHHQSSGTSAPTSGAWDRGNIVWNENPASGGKIGWVCVAGGSPGVWKSFGSIDA